MRLPTGKRIALVLSGGGVKAAAFHIGVCMALQEKGFRFAGGTRERFDFSTNTDSKTISTYVGSSAGAVVCAFLAAGYSVESLVDAFEMGAGGLRHRDHPLSPIALKPLTYFDIFSVNSKNLLGMVPNFFKGGSVTIPGGIEVRLKKWFRINGFFTTKGIERYLRKYVLPTNRFEELGVRLFIVATQLNHSRKVIFGPYKETSKNSDIKQANFSQISDAVAASAALPPVFAPYGIKNQKGKELFFFDGEIRDTLSTHVAADDGADFVISSYSIQPYHFNPKIGSLHNYGIPLILNQALYQLVEQKINRTIQRKTDLKALFAAVDGYFKQADLPEEHRVKLLEILEKRVDFNPRVEYVYIHPSPHDYEMFFVDHFSLNPRILGDIVRIGFRSTLAALRRYDV